MTAVDVDALDKLREAATNPVDWVLNAVLAELWRTDRPQVLIARDLGISTKHLSMIRQGHAEPSLGLLRQMCSLLTPELLAEVRRGRALREAVNGLAAKYDQPAEPGPWPEGTRSLYGGGQVAYDLLAALAATDGTP